MPLKESGFPLHEIQKRNYQLITDLLKNLEVYDDTELALLVVLKNIVGQLGQTFQKALGGVLESLYESVTNMTVFVKIDDTITLDSSFLNRMAKVIKVKFHWDAGAVCCRSCATSC